MLRRAFLGIGLLVVVGLTGQADSLGAAETGRLTTFGVVTKVVDGDTLDVRLDTGKQERVRVIGIDAPERGSCLSAQASARTKALVLSKRVVLRSDSTQATRDRYGRLLAYVDIAGKLDLGMRLVGEGFAEVYIYGRPFVRVSAYRSSEATAKSRALGIWGACVGGSSEQTPTPAPSPSPPPAPPPTAATPPPAPAPPASQCHPNYSNCLPIVGDLDCADVRRMGKAPVQVIGADPYRLDGDKDGLGCE